MGNQRSVAIADGHLSPRTLKRQLSEYALHSEKQVSVVKSSRLYDNDFSYEEGLVPGIDDEQTPVSPYALSWATSPSANLSIHGDADAYKILNDDDQKVKSEAITALQLEKIVSSECRLSHEDVFASESEFYLHDELSSLSASSGREDSITISEISISRPSSPEPELQISLSPRSDVGDGCDGFFPPTPRGHSPESRAETVCTPTSVRKFSLTLIPNLDSSDTPHGTRLSRRGGVCAFDENQIPASIRSLRSQHSEFENFGGGPCPEEGRTSHRRVKSLRDWTTTPIESTSSETLASPHPRRSLRRARTEYNSISSWRTRTFVEGSTTPNLIGGCHIP